MRSERFRPQLVHGGRSSHRGLLNSCAVKCHEPRYPVTFFRSLTQDIENTVFCFDIPCL